MSERIRVFLVDDHPVVREGFVRALEDAQDVTVVGEADTAADAMSSVARTDPDVVLVDLNLPDRDGVELLGALHNVVPRAKLVVLSACEDEFRVAEALRAGAHGYLL
ncbi:MAG TPA: response regulator transcription factor, partial [Minicystis sp.]|nr:response regulator transcription factor [Minicystis sp.]